jgi:hypothetical protein
MEQYNDLYIVYYISRGNATDSKTNCAKAIAIFLIIRYTEKNTIPHCAFMVHPVVGGRSRGLIKKFGDASWITVYSL